jgi:hypothetical protein
MADIQRISHTHEAVINWLVLNPEKSLRECADHFGYTQPWLSTLIHSDIFQMALRERQLAVAARVAQSIPERLRVCTDLALEKLADKIVQSEDPDFILDAADRTLHRMGFAPQSARNPAGSPGQAQGIQNQTNVFVLGHEDLAEARRIMATAGVPALIPVGAEGAEGMVYDATP